MYQLATPSDNSFNPRPWRCHQCKVDYNSEAMGCGNCGQLAPFIDLDGTPDMEKYKSDSKIREHSGRNVLCNQTLGPPYGPPPPPPAKDKFNYHYSSPLDYNPPPPPLPAKYEFDYNPPPPPLPSPPPPPLPPAKYEYGFEFPVKNGASVFLWECSSCFTVNYNDSCKQCGKPKTVKPPPSSSENSSPSYENQFVWEWECTYCSTVNFTTAGSTFCITCQKRVYRENLNSDPKQLTIKEVVTYLQAEKEHHQRIKKENQELLETVEDLKGKKHVLKDQVDQWSWRINSNELQVTSEELGRGGWGSVLVGTFREQRVAVKQLYNILKSEQNLAVMNREINTMSQLRHPNLLLFIGAVLDHPSGNPLIITEIMDTSLRQAYEKGQLTEETSKLSILRDTASGLNYLHCHHDEIIHRDVSSANVLLESRGINKWRAKLSDFGSANVARNAVTRLIGAQVYSAPESFVPIASMNSKPTQTTKMDVYSYGILVCEIMCCQFPESPAVFHTMLARVYTNSPPIGRMVQECTEIEPQRRPAMKKIIQQFNEILI